MHLCLLTDETQWRAQALEDMQRRLEKEHALQMSLLLAEQEKEQQCLHLVSAWNTSVTILNRSISEKKCFFLNDHEKLHQNLICLTTMPNFILFIYFAFFVCVFVHLSFICLFKKIVSISEIQIMLCAVCLGA